MNEWIDWFQRVLDVSIRLYFRQECDLSSVYDIALPKAGPLWKALLPEQVDPTFDEWMVLMLALMPHLSPQVLDIFFVHNKNFDRPYTVIWRLERTIARRILANGRDGRFPVGGRSCGTPSGSGSSIS